MYGISTDCQAQEISQRIVEYNKCHSHTATDSDMHDDTRHSVRQLKTQICHCLNLNKLNFMTLAVAVRCAMCDVRCALCVSYSEAPLIGFMCTASSRSRESSQFPSSVSVSVSIQLMRHQVWEEVGCT